MKACAADLEADAAAKGRALAALSGGGPMGLTPDHVRASPAWREASAAYAEAFQALRRFNQGFVRLYAREIRADRDAARAARTLNVST